MDGEKKFPVIVLIFKYVNQYAVLSKVVNEFPMGLKAGLEVGVGVHNS